jgi:hypothetical protein
MRALNCGAALAILAGGLVRAEPFPQTANAQLRLGVHPTSGALVEFTELSTGQNLLAPPAIPTELWLLEFADGRVLSPTNARAFRVAPLEGRESGLRLCWDGFAPPTPPDLRVVVTISLTDSPAMSVWRIAAENLGPETPRQLRFPRVLNVAARPGERLAVPVWMGQEAANPRALLNDARHAPRRFQWQYPGLLSMQCLALSASNAPGLFLSCDDPAGHVKAFAVFGGGETGLNLEALHWPERDRATASNWALPYSVRLAPFQGDWFDAAALYRTWATNQPWTRQSRLLRGAVPSWVTNTALWVWNRGASPDVLEPAMALGARLGLPVSVFWHWWHGCAYDAGFPEYFPPREGEAAFRVAVERAHQHGLHAIVYMNQRLWAMTTASWTNENAARFAVKTPDGRIQPEVYNTFTRTPCASMCMGTAFWRNKYAGLAAQAVLELGVDGIYMDQACTSLACFDPHHGHPLGGGTYWMEGFKQLAADIRQRCAARTAPVLAGEGCAENWLPDLDLMLCLQVSRERYAEPDGWETIPFFHAVYHGQCVFYGNYASLTMPPYDPLWPAEFAPKEPLRLLDRKFSRQFLLEQARAFVWGQQPTLANFRAWHFRDRAVELDYVLRLARLHAAARKYLLQGEMLPPPWVEAPSAELDMSRLSIYAGQQGALREFRKTAPLVLAAAWRAPDGALAVAVASLSDQPLQPTIRLRLPASTAPKAGRIYRISAGGRKPEGRFGRKDLLLRPKLAPLDACVLELKAD